MPERGIEKCTGRIGHATEGAAQPALDQSKPENIIPPPDLTGLVQLIAEAIVLRINTEGPG